ncbi:MerR family transcriptional regulator [Actinomadura sp. 6N118]|uniref:MerR family transcriptional regulator n=1 Tax=Actinomadura sp. 6N118 TaxID=3375151 RepID=UPI003792EFA8
MTGDKPGAEPGDVSGGGPVWAGAAGLRTGQVAQRAGVNIQTLRYYERRGLIAEPHRSPGGHRAYPPETVTVLRVIKAAQRLGFTLEEVADLLETTRHRHPRPGAADTALGERARMKLIEVEQRIADLRVIGAALSQTIDAGCTDLMECATTQCCPLPFADLARPDPGEQP